MHYFKCCWYLLAIQNNSMGMRIMLFTSALLCYVITLITNSYIDYLPICGYAKINKMGT
jgi:hypothetical protein